jgi:hypothetical protein
VFTYSPNTGSAELVTTFDSTFIRADALRLPKALVKSNRSVAALCLRRTAAALALVGENVESNLQDLGISAIGLSHTSPD